MRPGDFDSRIVSKIFLGLDFYILVFMLSQLVLSFVFEILLIEYADMYVSVDLVMGMLSICVSLAGFFAAHIMYGHFNRRYGIFSDVSGDGNGGLLSRMFSVSESSGVWVFIIFAALIISAQIGSAFVNFFIEKLLSLSGRTMSSSPAANVDYTLNILLILYSAFLGPITEEIVFRGYVLKGLGFLGRKHAVVISALLFSLMHGDISQTVFTFAAGLILGYAASRYSLRLSIALHIFNNGVLGLGMIFLSDALPYDIFYRGYLLLIIASLIISALYLERLIKERRIKHTVNNQSRGFIYTFKLCILNKWFLIFVIWGICSILLSANGI